MRILYRPEREETPRKGGRYFGRIRLAPGVNEFHNEADQKLFSDLFKTDEGKSLLKSTVLEELEVNSKVEARAKTQKTYISEPIVEVEGEDEPVKQPRRKAKTPTDE